jgi:hypothetical protein
MDRSLAGEQHYIANGFNEHRPTASSGDGGDNTLLAISGAIMTGGGAGSFVFHATLTKPATIDDFAAGTDHLRCDDPSWHLHPVQIRFPCPQLQSTTPKGRRKRHHEPDPRMHLRRSRRHAGHPLRAVA